MRDAAGDVYITDPSAKQIVEYAHCGTQPIETLSDGPDTPYTSSSTRPRETSPSRTTTAPKKRETSRFTRGRHAGNLHGFEALLAAGCAYDSTGALLVTNGSGYSTSGSFAWLPPGGRSPSTSTYPQFRLEMVRERDLWDGKFFVLDDDDLYRISLIHGQAY